MSSDSRSWVQLLSIFYTFGGHLAHCDNSHCPQVLPWQPFLLKVSCNGKVNKIAYFTGYWLDLSQILNPKQQ